MRFLSKKQVRDKISLSNASIDREEYEKKTFPSRKSIGFRVFWIEEEIDAWMRARASEGDTRPDKVFRKKGARRKHTAN